MSYCPEHPTICSGDEECCCEDKHTDREPNLVDIVRDVCHISSALAKDVLEAIGIDKPADWKLEAFRKHLERASRATELGWTERGNEAYLSDGTWTDNAAVVAEWVWEGQLPDPEGQPYDIVELEHAKGHTLAVHKADKCAGEHCTVHNRSDHPMRAFPQHWRGDRGIMERICPHGVGHPDPDEINPDTVHGCDGCCLLAAEWQNPVEDLEGMGS